MLDLDDTIVAIASARGGSLRGIVRLSGPRAWQLASSFFSPALPEVGRTFLPTALAGELSLPRLNSLVPATLFLSAAPRSFTGQDLVEVHTIGSPPILELALSSFVAAGARQASRGEFTMRAFLNGKLDLTAAEAVLGLIDATDERHAESALRQMAGGIARPIHALRDLLLNLLAELEAGLDFAHEDLEFIERHDVIAGLTQAHQQLEQLSRQMHNRLVTADRARVILAGWPNVGKSSLFNALLGRQVALVNHTAGTTRDYLIAPLVLPHATVELVDTAGTEQPDEAIGRMAQSARQQAWEFADLLLWCDDGASAGRLAYSGDSSAHPCRGIPPDASVIVVRTKVDLEATSLHADPCTNSGFFAQPAGHSRCAAISVSAVTGRGLQQLRDAIDQWARGLRGESAIVTSTATRCGGSIEAATAAVHHAIDLVHARASDDLTAMELRLALDELGQVVGTVYTDDILDRVFSRFCIGK